MLENKRKEKREEEERELRNLRNEKDIWRYINRRRKKREWKENSIRKEEWKEYFMKLLGGSEEKEEADNRNEEIGDKGDIGEIKKKSEEEKLLEEEEIVEAVKKMKIGKAAGIDGIPLEAWKYGGMEVRRRLVNLINQIWMDGEMPKEWRKSIVVPLYKRGDKERTENYRGISLLCSAYKIYAEILRNRLEDVMEKKGMLPESQAGFRKGRSTMDTIFILNHLVQLEKGKDKEKDKIFAVFVDLKAAFDNVDREISRVEIDLANLSLQLVAGSRRLDMLPSH
ncbi:rna-directed dna polymerase from mobile element jockey-like protein [Lasius niger]|uniref:Rna-directed dna polymerase from mobile element jockey-like protein n=1 Tax=Lasius niger TaxID=67767 RepID=A0A0J7L068_LASNI|nr:rna-directed dna polymerase from mobile element jockey-like protein [Lasius niger]